MSTLLAYLSQSNCIAANDFWACKRRNTRSITRLRQLLNPPKKKKIKAKLNRRALSFKSTWKTQCLLTTESLTSAFGFCLLWTAECSCLKRATSEWLAVIMTWLQSQFRDQRFIWLITRCSLSLKTMANSKMAISFHSHNFRPILIKTEVSQISWRQS